MKIVGKKFTVVRRFTPGWICDDCGKKLSDKQFELSTWHTDKCDVCGKTVAVTEPRDFFINDTLQEIEEVK